MSRLLMSAIAAESQAQPALSLESMRSWFYQNQLGVQEDQYSQEVIVHEIEELNHSTAVLESLEAELTTEAQNNGSLSFESCRRLESVLKAISGNDQVKYVVSLESINDDPDATTEMTLESLSSLISDAKNYLGDRYRALMEKARWLERGFFDVVKRHRKYIDGLISKTDEMDRSIIGGRLKTSSYVQNYLHVNGNTAPKTILDGLKTNNDMMKDVVALAPQIKAAVGRDIEDAIDSLFEAVRDDKSSDQIEKQFEESLAKIMDKTSKQFSKTMEPYADKSMLGGKIYRFSKVKLERSFTLTTLVGEDDEYTKADPFSVASKGDTVAILNELKRLTSHIQTFKDSASNSTNHVSLHVDKVVGSKTGDDNEISKLKMFLFAVFVAIVVAAVLGGLATYLGGVVYAKFLVPAIFWTKVVALVVLATSLIRTVLAFRRTGSRESLVEEANIEVSVKQLESKVNETYVAAFTEIASHINAVLRAGLEYSHASIEAAGVSTREPDVDTSQ